ncbi:Metalloproteinase inhibitor 2 [Caenorhabditis elegans]|uniref:Metalloproteinase inhibitor 2 n=1 Tax=Caenorhabditis elegans TaxID=6239 RepID=Q9TYL1_CAEEL|nr:Metalloproteinase inhibitor 2 [Caenorhabditis elegans]CCD61994.1 Metalloproteinase inhibitor 2 [Caenorhabditis elegans]|eukprot:NP_494449.2 Uncharacterized protein CELE_Y25C1A.2 [Caenorhabditis elegans]
MRFLVGFMSLVAIVVTAEHGCADSCSMCPDIQSIFSNKTGSTILYSEGPGCVRNLTCTVKGTFTSIYSAFSVSDVPRPENIADHPEVDTMIIYATSVGGSGGSGGVGVVIDLYSFYGIVCEDAQWYATKYPYGISYTDSDGGWMLIGFNGELDGKRSLIKILGCSQ